MKKELSNFGDDWIFEDKVDDVEVKLSNSEILFASNFFCPYTVTGKVVRKKKSSLDNQEGLDNQCLGPKCMAYDSEKHTCKRNNS